MPLRSFLSYMQAGVLYVQAARSADPSSRRGSEDRMDFSVNFGHLSIEAYE